MWASPVHGLLIQACLTFVKKQYTKSKFTYAERRILSLLIDFWKKYILLPSTKNPIFFLVHYVAQEFRERKDVQMQSDSGLSNRTLNTRRKKNSTRECLRLRESHHKGLLGQSRYQKRPESNLVKLQNHVNRRPNDSLANLGNHCLMSKSSRSPCRSSIAHLHKKG